MIISFEFPERTIDLRVDLLDNPPIRSWADHFLSEPFEVSSHIINNTVTREYNAVQVSELHARCVGNIKHIEKLVHMSRDIVPVDISDLNRDWCNQAHRFFTHTQQFANAISDKLTDRLQELNDDIHQIENYLPPCPLAPIDFSTDEIFCTNFPTYNASSWWHMNDPKWRRCHTADHATVILGPQILGKSILRSYLDSDNPNDWDTTGHYCNHGALLIQVSDFRNRIYTSKPFHSWLRLHGVRKPLYDFPVGTIADLALVNEVYQKLQNTSVPVKTIYKQ